MAEPVLCYGLVDAEGVLINPVAVEKDDFLTLEKLKEEHNASTYHFLDDELYVVRVGKIYWNGTFWDNIVNKP